MPSDVPAVMKTRSADTGNPFVGVFGRHRFARGGNAGRGTVVVVAVAKRPLDGGNQMRRRLEAEGHRIADVQVSDPCACRFHFLRLRDDVPDGVGEAVNTGGGRNIGLNFGCCHVAILPDVSGR